MLEMVDDKFCKMRCITFVQQKTTGLPMVFV